jgi:hypothetical protein
LPHFSKTLKNIEITIRYGANLIFYENLEHFGIKLAFLTFGKSSLLSSLIQVRKKTV